MIKRSLRLTPLLFAGLLLAGCSGTKNIAGNTPSLKETFKGDFLIGTALNATQIEEKDAGAAALVQRHFNAVTPENIMKAEEIHPEWGRYNFELADKMVAYAQKHNLQVNAHTLIWHSQLPRFVRQMKDADSVRRFFTEHINTVAGRYDGKVHTWDVVNEALEEDGTMRKSIFLDKMGEDFVVEAFRLAQKASPNAKLYYNDYNIEEPKKRAGAIRLIKKIQEAGVRIDGVGIQGHWRAYNVPLAHIEQSIKEYAALGLEVAFTELDLGVLQHPREVVGADVNQKAAYEASMNPYTTALPDSMQQKLSNNYAALFQLFLKYSNNISRITFWGVHDGQSWLNDWPIPGRTNHPLLFDRKFQPKPAFYKVIETKTNQPKQGF